MFLPLHLQAYERKMSQKLSFFSPQDTAFGQNRAIFWAQKLPERSMLQISKPFLSRNRNDQGRPEVPYFSPDLFIGIAHILHLCQASTD